MGDRLEPDVTESHIDLGRPAGPLLYCQPAGVALLGGPELLGHLLPLPGIGTAVGLCVDLARSRFG